MHPSTLFWILCFTPGDKFFLIIVLISSLYKKVIFAFYKLEWRLPTADKYASQIKMMIILQLSLIQIGNRD